MFWTLLAFITAAYFLLDWAIRLLKVGNYSSKYVFITGCDSGFGRDLAIRLDKLGFPVFAGCLTQDGRRSLTETCSSRLETLTLNVADNDSIQEAFQTVKQKLPNERSLWAVVNNAGVPGPVGAIEMFSHQDFIFTSSVNLFGAINVSRIFMTLLRKSQGRLVLMTSVMGRCPAATAPYAVSKFGLEAFGDVCRREVSRFGVKVSMIEPGYFRTNIISHEKLVSGVRELYNKAGPDVQASYGKDFVDQTSDVLKGSIDYLSPDTYKVVDAYVAAITSVYPRPRHVVGRDAKFVFVPLSFAPEWFVDWLLISQRKRIVNKIRSKGK